ncbi:MAG: pyridoxine 5'-phosphate synthase [Chthoniobacterales bacterium]
MLHLGVNIDHVATLRQARYRETPDSPNAEPDPVEAALAAERAGAHGITVHLRADRRHIQDRDLWRIKEKIRSKLNLEMGNSGEILEIALQLNPEDVCLVPENRQEVTTEGGLDCAGQIKTLHPTIQKLQSSGIRVSLFIDPDPAQIDAAAKMGTEFIELHTGAYANHFEEKRDKELQRLIDGANQAAALGLKVNAGHGLNCANIGPILKIPHLFELNIGHSIISRALTVGMEVAVTEMLALLNSPNS